MQSLQEQKASSIDQNSSYQLEYENYRGLCREDFLLFWFWLATLVLATFVVLSGAFGLLAGRFIIVNQVTAGLITALIGAGTGAICTAISRRRKDIVKQKDNSRKKLVAMSQRSQYLGLASSTSNKALKEKSNRVYVASLDKNQGSNTPALLNQSVQAGQPQASTNYQDGYAGNA